MTHIEAWSTIPGVAVTHLMGHRDRARTEALAREFNIESVLMSGEKLPKGAIDVLDVVASPKLRLEALRMAAEAGIPRVNLEKPLALSLQEQRQILVFRESSGIQITVNHQKRFLPGITAALAAIHAGEIGEPRLISGTCMGSLHNQGNHVLDLIGQIIPLENAKLQENSRFTAVDSSGFEATTGWEMRFAHPQADIDLRAGSAGRWIGPGEDWLQVGVDVLGTLGSVSFGINKTALVLSAVTGRITNANSWWESDKVLAQAQHLRFVLNATEGEAEAVFNRASTANALLLESEARA
jgi:predicted dehydrogenase